MYVRKVPAKQAPGHSDKLQSPLGPEATRPLLHPPPLVLSPASLLDSLHGAGPHNQGDTTTSQERDSEFKCLERFFKKTLALHRVKPPSIYALISFYTYSNIILTTPRNYSTELPLIT